MTHSLSAPTIHVADLGTCLNLSTVNSLKLARANALHGYFKMRWLPPRKRIIILPTKATHASNMVLSEQGSILQVVFRALKSSRSEAHWMVGEAQADTPDSFYRAPRNLVKKGGHP